MDKSIKPRLSRLNMRISRWVSYKGQCTESEKCLQCQYGRNTVDYQLNLHGKDVDSGYYSYI